MRRVEIDSQRVIFDDFFRIEEATLRFERFDGRMSRTVRRLNFERGDAAAALLRNTDTERVVLTNQFKYPTYRNGSGWVAEVVAGTVEPGDDPAETVRREILEETGYAARQLEPIATFYVSPGGTSERIFLYYAEVTTVDKIAPGGGVRSEDEDIQLLEFTLPELWAALAAGEIVDAKTLVALMWLQSRPEVGT
jgi:ADP-ribose pyrophosphatase